MGIKCCCSLTIFVVVLIFAIPLVAKGCSLLEKRIDEQERNKFDILLAQINSLNVEDGEKTFPISIKARFQIETYKRCKETEEIGCSPRPKICLRDTTNQKINPYCRYIEKADFDKSDTLSAVNGLKLKKIEVDKKTIIQVSQKT